MLSNILQAIRASCILALYSNSIPRRQEYLVLVSNLCERLLRTSFHMAVKKNVIHMPENFDFSLTSFPSSALDWLFFEPDPALMRLFSFSSSGAFCINQLRYMLAMTGIGVFIMF